MVLSIRKYLYLKKINQYIQLEYTGAVSRSKPGGCFLKRIFRTLADYDCSAGVCLFFIDAINHIITNKGEKMVTKQKGKPRIKLGGFECGIRRPEYLGKTPRFKLLQ
jgi:hypothetical protein